MVEPKLEEVFMNCKRGSDKRTHGESCPSSMAYKLSSDGSNVVSYRCTKCKYQWSVAVGGSFSVL